MIAVAVLVLHINHDHLTHDLSRHQRTISFDFSRWLSVDIDSGPSRRTNAVESFARERLIRKATAAITIALKTGRAIAGHLFVVHARDVTCAERTIDREVVATS